MSKKTLSPPNIFFSKEPDYSLFEPKLEAIKSMLRVINQSVVIIDYYRNVHAFVSLQELMHVGYTDEEIYIIGKKEFSRLVLIEEEIAFIGQIQSQFISYLHNLPRNRRDKFTAYFNHHFRHKTGHLIAIDMHFTPFLFDEQGNLWMVLAKLTQSPKTQALEAYIEMTDTMERLEYSFKEKCFLPTMVVTLTTKEKMVLLGNSRGYTEYDIGMDMQISINTVKFHKRNIMKKTRTKTLSEAFVYASSHRLL